jgi:glyoxylase-like metal-dependent hydrolase (beta-lactamase superfamily II)
MMTTLPSRLQWEVLIRKRPSSTQGIPPGKENLAWVTNAATLIWGDCDALLVDTFLSDAQNEELAAWIASKRRTLRTIYLTHAHPDHFFGLAMLLERFPEARAIARPGVIRVMRSVISPEFVERFLVPRMAGQIPRRLAIAEELGTGRFELEGNELRVVELGHTDTDETTALHVPSLGLLVAGDAVYNETHPFLTESNIEGRNAWIAAIDCLEALKPRIVIASHGPFEPDHSPRHLAATRAYLRDFNRLDRETTSAQELYNRMLALYPDRINPGSLWGGANAAKGA